MKTYGELTEMREAIKNKYANELTIISRIVNSTRLVDDRQDKLIKAGYTIAERPMGSGGLLQFKKVKDEIRVQIGYGHSRNNYAMCVILK
jgi:hypothetical protein